MLTLENPVFAAYAVAAGLMILKLMGQGWVTVARMMKAGGGFLNPEDARQGAANPKPRPGQLEPEPSVERSRRMQRNDLENIPAFLVAGLLFVTTAPPYGLAVALFAAFVLARAAHAWAYATAQSHEVRATFFTIGSVVVMIMAALVIVAAVI